MGAAAGTLGNVAVSAAFAGEDAALGGGEIVEGTDGDLSSVVAGLAFGGGD